MTEEVGYVKKIWYDKKINRLENKVKRLKKEREDMRERFREYYEFWRQFIFFYRRFTNRKYDHHWPIERIGEALLNLKEKSP